MNARTINTDQLDYPSGAHPRPFRILILEDNPHDAELIEYELKTAHIPFLSARADTREEFLKHIDDSVPDVILADYNVPQFSALEALGILHEHKKDIPFILVTGSQSEEVAVECIHRGAYDYILKQSLKRLPSALINAVKKKEAERIKERAEEQLRETNEQLRALSAHLQSIREEERKRIAREIHDELGQTMTALRLDLAWLQGKLSSTHFLEVHELLEQVVQMSTLVDSSIQTVRRIATELRPRILDDLGLIPALEWQTEEFETRTGIQCTFSSSVEEIHLDQERNTAVFRILQESLTNVMRHADASHVDVQLTLEEHRLILEIVDNGKGLQDESPTLQSMGLIGMRERALLLNGVLRVQRRPEGGTLVRVEIPTTK